METPENIFYGINVNDKSAVEKEFLRLKRKHRNITIVVMIVLFVLGVITFDFCRVNFFDAKPIFAIEKKVEKGTLFSGIGYKVLYCSNGEKYLGSVLYKTCEEPDMIEFGNLMYEKVVDYSVDKKLLSKGRLRELKFNSVIFDEYNDKGGSDYLANISYQCKDDSVTCFKLDKEFYDIENINIYIRINKYNEVYDIVSFKTTGAYYDRLIEKYTEDVKTYLIENEKLQVDNLRSFKLKLVENSGKYNFRNTVYADSYLIEINYMCLDNSNTCLEAVDNKDYEGDYSNLIFYASMFINEDGTIGLIGPREYLDL
jgi:hypothetical protein